MASVYNVDVGNVWIISVPPSFSPSYSLHHLFCYSPVPIHCCFIELGDGSTVFFGINTTLEYKQEQYRAETANNRKEAFEL